MSARQLRGLRLRNRIIFDASCMGVHERADLTMLDAAAVFTFFSRNLISLARSKENN